MELQRVFDLISLEYDEKLAESFVDTIYRNF